MFNPQAAWERCEAATARARKTQTLLLEALKALPMGDLSPTEANMATALNGACEDIVALSADLPAALEALEEAQGKLEAEIKVTVVAGKNAPDERYYDGRLNGLLFVRDRILFTKEDE